MLGSTTITADRIEKRILLRAPRARVWRALSDASEFGAWFGSTLHGTIAPGATLRGTGCGSGHAITLTIERVEPQRLLSYRWHPFCADPAAIPDGEPTTLVEFHLADAAEGTELVVIESGFARLSPQRCAEAFPRHEAGWVMQLGNIERHVAS